MENPKNMELFMRKSWEIHGKLPMNGCFLMGQSCEIHGKLPPNGCFFAGKITYKWWIQQTTFGTYRRVFKHVF